MPFTMGADVILAAQGGRLAFDLILPAPTQSLLGARLLKRRRNAKHVFYALADDHVLMLVRSAIDHATERILPPAQAGTSIKETRR